MEHGRRKGLWMGHSTRLAGTSEGGEDEERREDTGCCQGSVSKKGFCSDSSCPSIGEYVEARLDTMSVMTA